MNTEREEWQDPDSGYLNCIGVGDTYVRRQMERILSSGGFDADIKTQKNVMAHRNVYSGVQIGKPSGDNRPTDEELTELIKEFRKLNNL
jgi:hypothetical protein